VAESEGKQISANFYEALNGLNFNSDSVIVEFTARDWSPTVRSNKFEYSDIKLTNDYYQPISAVVGKLKEHTNTSKEIIGRIRKLEALPIIDKRKTGTVTSAYIDDNKSHSVTTKLERFDYDKVIEAHQQGKYVKVLGEIKRGKKSTMECSAFSIVE